MTKVLVIEGGDAQGDVLRRIFDEARGFDAASTRADEMLAVMEERAPDIVVVAHKLPVIDGLDVTRRIMETYAVPIVLVTASSKPGEVATGFDAMDIGALAVVQCPSGSGDTADRAVADELLKTVRIMSEVKVVRRWPRRARVSMPSSAARPQRKVELVAVGASTGGPVALAALFGGLPKDFGAPIVVVQHMAAGFMRGFVDWLAPSSALPIHIASDGEYVRAGHIYIAPDNVQMRVTQGNRLVLEDAPRENGLRPSVACLFRSVAQVGKAHAAGVLLTGMGRDGAAELKMMRDAGAVTFAQDSASSIVHGMPGEAIKLGAAMHVLPPAAIAVELGRLSMSQQRESVK